VLIETRLGAIHPVGMKKVVVFSDSGIFIQTIQDTAAEKSEE
jgi:hypothetical protein